MKNDGDPLTNAQSKPAKGIREVAEVAEVSVATVSRVFNHPETVRRETRDHVHRAATKLGYIPDSAARQLGSQVSRRIGLLVPTIEDSIFAKFIESLHHEISKSGYTLLLGSYGFSPEREKVEIRGLIESGVDGIILCGEERSEDFYNLLIRQEMPFINFNIYAPDSRFRSIGPDFRLAAQQVTEHLIGLGHTEFGVLDLFQQTNDRALLRRQGINDALAKHGLKIPQDRFVERALGFADGRLGFKTLCQMSPEITAIICGTDVLAVGAMFEARDAGISIPKDMSITGFDNLEIAAQVAPKLTTIDLPSGEMGLRAAESIVSLIDGKPIPHAIQLEANLIVRGSTGPRPD